MQKVLKIISSLVLITLSCVIFLTKESKTIFTKEEVKKLRTGNEDESIEPTERLINLLARPFNSASDHSWCVENKHFNESSPTGLLFVKVPKTASSTISGVAERIARKYGNTERCALKDEHRDRFLYKRREKAKSFLCGSIRDPSSRALSHIFYIHVSTQHKDPTDENIIEWLQPAEKNITKSQHRGKGKKANISNGQGGYQLNFMSMHDIPANSAYRNIDGKKVLNYESIEKNIKIIMEDYDYIILNERLDESMVAMAILLDLSVGDILYLPSKVSGGYLLSGRKCNKIRKSFVSPAVSEYLFSKEWQQEIYGDVLLHAVINKSLDLTIEMIGEDKFEKEYNEYIRLKNVAVEICSPKAFFPCSVDGLYQVNKARHNCYHKDWGCGYPCLDELVQNETRKT